jgi:hypothetical protein
VYARRYGIAGTCNARKPSCLQLSRRDACYLRPQAEPHDVQISPRSPVRFPYQAVQKVGQTVSHFLRVPSSYLVVRAAGQ